MAINIKAINLWQENPGSINAFGALLITALSGLFLFLMTAEGLTWVNVGSDGADYLIAAKYWRIAHPTGEPLYLMLSASWLWAWQSTGIDQFHLMAATSVVFSAATAGLLYYHTRKIIAPLLWISSGLVISQSTIVELYALISFLIVLAYHLHTLGRLQWTYVVVGLGLAVHHLMGLLWIGLIVRDIIVGRRLEAHPTLISRLALPALIALPFYLYIPMANSAPYLTISGDSFANYLHYFTSQTSLIGGLAIFGSGFLPSEDLRERAWDFARIVLSFGPALVFLVIAWRREWTQGRVFLPLMVLTFFVYYATDLAPQVYTYTMPGIALGIILLCKAELSKVANAAILIFASGLLVINFSLYDIGRNLDETQAAAAFYAGLDSLPEGAILWSENRGWEKMTVELWNLNQSNDSNDLGDSNEPIDTITIRQPRPNFEELRIRLERAESHGQLFRTVITAPSASGVLITKATAASVLQSIEEHVLLGWRSE